jgi:hypothetical protein
MEISDKYCVYMKMEDRRHSAAKSMTAFLRRAAPTAVSFFDPVPDMAILEQNKTDIRLAKEISDAKISAPLIDHFAICCWGKT